MSQQNVHWKIRREFSSALFFINGAAPLRRRRRSFLPWRLLPKEPKEPKDSKEPDHAAEDAPDSEITCSTDVIDGALRTETDLEWVPDSSLLEAKPV